MADDQTSAEIDGVGAWETIAMVIMLAMMAAGIACFAYALAKYGIGH